MRADEVFTDGSRLEVRWNRAAVVPNMERALRVLFAAFGLEFTASGSDLVRCERSVVFHPKRAPVEKST